MFILALLKPSTATEMDHQFPSNDLDGNLRLGSMADPEHFQRTAETYNSTSTTFRFDKDATTLNQKRRGTTLTANLTAGVIRCPENNGFIQVEFIQDSTGSRTIPTITAVKADGTTAVTVANIGSAQFTATTTASKIDAIMYRYDEAAAILKEVRRNLAMAS